MYLEIALQARVAQKGTNAKQERENRATEDFATLGYDSEKKASTMSLQDLLKLIATLTPKQQEAVAEFVSILKNEQRPGMNFRAALDEFVGKHPELLRRLAQ